MSDLQKTVLKSKLPPFIAPPPRLTRGRSIKDYTPSMWSQYFNSFQDVKTEKGTFRVYLSAEPKVPGPLLLLLHGGGFSALTWSLFNVEITNIIHCQCAAIDFRGHGSSETDNDEDLSAEILANDVGDVIRAMYPENMPPIILIGHSMGGAIAVHIGNLELLPTLIGITVIDVVEGTAMEALASMQSFLRSRPTHFKSIPQAIEWCVRSGQIRNLDSAKVSMPGQIINTETKLLAINELPIFSPSESTEGMTKFSNPLSIPEDETEDENGEKMIKMATSPPLSTSPYSTSPYSTSPYSTSPLGTSPVSPSGMENAINSKKYTWRIDLSKSEKFWRGWFQGLSETFLNLRVPKLLLLASIDGLDRTLTVGQMQGKFQMQVLARCGHAVHEDRPSEVAEVVGSYLLRNKFAEASGDFVRQMPAC